MSDGDWNAWTNCPNSCNTTHTFSTKPVGFFDLVVVVNWSRRICMVQAPKNRAVKLVQEPPKMGSLTHRFVDHHSRAFSVVRGHEMSRPRGYFRGKFESGYLFLPWKVDLLNRPAKKKAILSIIASRQTVLHGHLNRTRFVDESELILRRHGAQIFGKGRTFVEQKADGLDPFMYSIAIENTSISSYLTEKFTDCILRDVVPIYFGDPDADRIFPKASFLRLEALTPKALEDCLSTINEDDYASRLPAIQEAKRRIQEELRFCCWATSLLSSLPAGPMGKYWFGVDLSALSSRLRTRLGFLLGR